MRNATRPRSAHPPAGAHVDRFGGIDEAAPRPRACEPDYSAIAESAEFLDLRARLRRFVFPMSAVFLIWYLGYVIAAAYLPEFMGIRLVGEINVGLLMGVGQFASTILITALYLRFASRQIDPRVFELHREATGEEPE
ncbi:DUF485 domain-containing protein [Saccharopolyspora rosea]|uniref:DUF485 domain-containing protein n=1 Tax=Saccharopolyspora rosea TaxID=524884 RepID=A0ABW3FZH3_9PSEU